MKPGASAPQRRHGRAFGETVLGLGRTHSTSCAHGCRCRQLWRRLRSLVAGRSRRAGKPTGIARRGTRSVRSPAKVPRTATSWQAVWRCWACVTDIGRTSRAVLAIGGVATVVVAALPQPNTGHVPAATVGFLALAVWPGASRLRFRGARATAVILLCLLAWLALELRGGSLLGLSERVLAGAEAFTPLAFAAVVIGRRWRPRRRRGADAAQSRS